MSNLFGGHKSSHSSNSPYLVPSALGNDTRSASTQSLLSASHEPNDLRRKLLLIYIHGFMGDETSFRSFPAHVHNLATMILSENYIVHTKIYPRYKSKNKIDMVAEDFSAWLTPHEDPNQDIILLGHSMGGLLSAEIILMRSKGNDPSRLRHRVLGSINFDVPFLGLHPSIISSGIASLWRPQDTTTTIEPPTESGVAVAVEGQKPQRHNTIFEKKDTDPTYNPIFINDQRHPVRKGWKSTMHFLSKHSDGLVDATKKYVKSHVEFGGVMADYKSLKGRYSQIRPLDDGNDGNRKIHCIHLGIQPYDRVRFVNYYTACFGWPKKPKEDQTRSEADNSRPVSSSNSATEFSGTDLRLSEWPPLPDIPAKPQQLDLAQYENLIMRDTISREYERAIKAYSNALADRETVIADRKAAEDKILQQHQQFSDATTSQIDESQSQISSQERPDSIVNSIPFSALSTTDSKNSNSLTTTSSAVHVESVTSQGSAGSVMSSSTGKEKPLKEKRFCMLPTKDSDGKRDDRWEKIDMGFIDEVTAHTGLFMTERGYVYESLVGDVAAKIENWVRTAECR